MAISDQLPHWAVCQFPLVPKGRKRSTSCLSSNISIAVKTSMDIKFPTRDYLLHI